MEGRFGEIMRRNLEGTGYNSSAVACSQTWEVTGTRTVVKCGLSETARTNEQLKNLVH